MARSPLIRTLQRLATEHAEASWRRVELGTVREEPAAASTGRRKFLQGVGAATGSALLSRSRMAKAAAAQPRIAIVGGGIAGLSAALTLQDSGFASSIYEASSRIGGRMHSDTTDWENGQKSEWCGEFIDTGHTTILGLASRFELTVVDQVAAQPAGSGDTLYFRGHYYSQAQADADFAPVNKILQRQINQAPSTLYNSYTPIGYYLDHLSLHNWIELYVPNGHRSVLGRYLDSAYNQEYGLDTTLQSSLNLVYLLGFQPTPGPTWQIYGFSDQRYTIASGNELLPQAIAAYLKQSSPRCSVITQSKLIKIARTSGAYTLTFATPTGQNTVVADEVILTLPFSILRHIDYSLAGFDSLKHEAIELLGYGTNSKLALQFDQRWWDTEGAWGLGDGNIYTDLFFQNTWDSSRGVPGTTGVLTGYMGGTNGASFTAATSPYASVATDPAVTSYAMTFLKQLEHVWPGITPYWNGLATLSTPWTDPNLLGSYACWKVGQYTRFAGYEGVRQGNCHFAGEHCSINFQGYMEGAAEEGIRAANEILSD
jgi:monoamine oxidase